MKRTKEQIKQDLLNDFGYKIEAEYFKTDVRIKVIDIISGIETEITLSQLYEKKTKKWEERKRIFQLWKKGNVMREQLERVESQIRMSQQFQNVEAQENREMIMV